MILGQSEMEIHDFNHFIRSQMYHNTHYVATCYLLSFKWPRLDLRVITLYSRLRTFIRLRHAAGLRRNDHIQMLAARQAQKPSTSSKPVVATKRRFLKAKQFARGASHL